MTSAKSPKEAADLAAHAGGLRTIAIVEAVKGLLVLAAGLGLLTLLGKDVHDEVVHLVISLHLNPAGHFSKPIVNAADSLTDGRLWAIAGGALAYSVVRWIEAWGLWNARAWAEWFALVSGSLYLPWELYEIVVHPGPVRWLVFLGNLGIVLYMANLRIQAMRTS